MRLPTGEFDYYWAIVVPVRSLRQRFLVELHPRNLIPSITTGLIVGTIVVIVAISLASLIFHGKLSEHLAEGIGLTLFSGILVTSLIALLSSYPGMVAYPQERVAPILALIAAIIVERTSDHASTEALFLTVVAGLAVAALATGVFLLALGAFRLGNLIRFIPYPVIGGFLAGTGWLLVKGSIGVMTARPLQFDDLPTLFGADLMPHWVFGVAFGLLLLILTHRWHHYLVMPSLLLGGIALFYGVIEMAGVSVIAAQDQGWLLGPFQVSGSWQSLTGVAFSRADWSLVVTQWGNVLTILLITVVSVLLTSSAMELIGKTDIDLNRELVAAGMTNILIGLGGGTVGFHSLSLSRLAHRMGPPSRLVGFVAAGMCSIMLAIGTGPLAYFPRPLLGGLLFYLGMHFLMDWVGQAWFRLTRADYTVVIMILGTVAVFGYLHGVAVGIVACVILFVVNYSRVNVVKHAITGVDRHSKVDRPSRHMHLLREKGRQICIFRLQGFIFFGTAKGLLERVRHYLAGNEAPLRFLLFDFGGVTGIDSSSMLSFVKIRQLAEKGGFTLIFTALSPSIRRLLERDQFNGGEENAFRTFFDLDVGLECCEDHFLREANLSPNEYDNISLSEQLKQNITEEIDIASFLEYFERMEVGKGDVLIQQGDPSDALFLIERGQVTARLAIPGGEMVRLRTMCSGTIVGEMGLILGEARSASVVADRPSTVYRLKAASLDRMRKENPELAASFFRYLTRLMAERLANSNHALQTLLE